MLYCYTTMFIHLRLSFVFGSLTTSSSLIHPIASNAIASYHPIAPCVTHRIASHPITWHRMASHRTASIQGCQKLAEPHNVLRKFSGSLRNVVVPPIGDPPGIPFEVQGHRRVHGYSVADVDLIVQSAVYDHDGTLGLGHPVDVGVNIETGERATRRQYPHPAHKGRMQDHSTQPVHLLGQVAARPASDRLPVQNNPRFVAPAHVFEGPLVDTGNVRVGVGLHGDAPRFAVSRIVVGDDVAFEGIGENDLEGVHGPNVGGVSVAVDNGHGLSSLRVGVGVGGGDLVDDCGTVRSVVFLLLVAVGAAVVTIAVATITVVRIKILAGGNLDGFHRPSVVDSWGLQPWIQYQFVGNPFGRIDGIAGVSCLAPFFQGLGLVRELLGGRPDNFPGLSLSGVVISVRYHLGAAVVVVVAVASAAIVGSIVIGLVVAIVFVGSSVRCVLIHPIDLSIFILVLALLLALLVVVVVVVVVVCCALVVVVRQGISVLVESLELIEGRIWWKERKGSRYRPLAEATLYPQAENGLDCGWADAAHAVLF